MIKIDDQAILFAEQFLLRSIRHGLAHSFDVFQGQWTKPYPEVTGYLLSYFCEYAETLPAGIREAADKLCTIQHRCGGYASYENQRWLFTFDTGQIMHGLTAIYQRTNKKKYLAAALRAAAFLMERQIENGALFPVYDVILNASYVKKTGSWGLSFSPIQAKCIEGLIFLYELTNDERYRRSATRMCCFGNTGCDLTYTHPGAYCLEGLWAMGEKEFVREALKSDIIPRIRTNGFLPYAEHLPYAYVSGSAQMGILLVKAGFSTQAASILTWVQRVQSQHQSGGLFQYANADGSLNHDVHAEINTWGTKYYAELARLFTT